MTKKIALGLSGGVDSAVSALLLKQAGYDVTCIYLECWKMPGCRAEKDHQDALKIALQLDLPFKVLDFRDEYQQRVMNYFLEEYQAGRTPNPDVLCNRVIKFGMFYQWAMAHGFDAIATGHYARVEKRQTKVPVLATAKDLHKDQTYFLHQIRQEQLDHVLFPIGDLEKDKVRKIAQENELHVWDKKDSVGICFVGDINVREFLEENLGTNPGEVVNEHSHILGQHQGLWFYTIGQRRGYELDTQAVKDKTNWTDDQGDVPPLYVIDKNQNKNQLVIGPEIETETREWRVEKLHWINPSLDWNKKNLLVRIRHTGELVPCQLEKQVVETSKAVKGVASGQFSVFYTRIDPNQKIYACLGGGVIG